MNTIALAFTSTLVGLALFLGLHTLGRRSARVRYALSAAALLALMALPIITTASRYLAAEPGRDATVATPPSSAVGRAADQQVTDIDPWRDATR